MRATEVCNLCMYNFAWALVAADDSYGSPHLWPWSYSLQWLHNLHWPVSHWCSFPSIKKPPDLSRTDGIETRWHYFDSLGRHTDRHFSCFIPTSSLAYSWCRCSGAEHGSREVQPTLLQTCDLPLWSLKPSAPSVTRALLSFLIWDTTLLGFQETLEKQPIHYKGLQ